MSEREEVDESLNLRLQDEINNFWKKTEPRSRVEAIAYSVLVARKFVQKNKLGFDKFKIVRIIPQGIRPSKRIYAWGIRDSEADGITFIGNYNVSSEQLELDDCKPKRVAFYSKTPPSKIEEKKAEMTEVCNLDDECLEVWREMIDIIEVIGEDSEKSQFEDIRNLEERVKQHRNAIRRHLSNKNLSSDLKYLLIETHTLLEMKYAKKSIKEFLAYDEEGAIISPLIVSVIKDDINKLYAGLITLDVKLSGNLRDDSDLEFYQGTKEELEKFMRRVPFITKFNNSAVETFKLFKDAEDYYPFSKNYIADYNFQSQLQNYISPVLERVGSMLGQTVKN